MSVNVITPDQKHTFEVGDFVEQLMVTDTLVFEVVKVTPHTITVRTTKENGRFHNRHPDGNPFPITFGERVSDPEGETSVLRRRKDGTFRKWNSAPPMRPARTVDGVPVNRTDYRL